jgi:hypothetical protein
MGINLVISDEFWRSKAYHKIINFPRGNLSCVLDRNKYLLLGNCKLHICRAKLEEKKFEYWRNIPKCNTNGC